MRDMDKYYGDSQNDDKRCDIVIIPLSALHPVGGAHGYILYVIHWSDGVDTQPILVVPPPDWMTVNPLADQQEVAIAIFECNDACLIGHPMVPYIPPVFSLI